ncbi:MAG: MmgE/PrpD family protein, partial [Deltaproteobacteria bacterium]|nr:MmgE/PrpD family protein [Deltaproteobacteria bacterium]
MSVTQDIARFSADISYEDLPGEAVRECRRLLLDTLGCALGGLLTEKGRIGLRLAHALGGPPESTLLGGAVKGSVAAASYLGGELMNALDYESLLSPPDHVTPYVLAAPLAVAEMKRVSGKELLTAIALSHELTTRIGSSLLFGNRFAVELPERGITMGLPTPGYGVCTFGGTAAAARLLGLDADGIARAMGIAGYAAPVPMLMTFAHGVPAALPKYLSSGMLSMQEALAAASAALGSSGDRDVLDGPYGFWRAFGCDGWRPEIVTHELGRDWTFPNRLFYKSFPCCGAMQNGLALFSSLLEEHELQPEDIVSVRVKQNLLAELPVWRSERVTSHIDAQFNVPFVFAAAALRIEPGPRWQAPET